jgi:phage terminase large subunit
MARITEATKKLLKLKKRIRCICGGTSASKTYSILMILIDYAQSNRNKKIDIMSESYPHLEDGAIKDFKEIMLDRGYWKDHLWNSTKHAYIFETGSVIKFISIDKLGKAHGPRRDVLFINEANNIDFSIYEQLEVRTKEIIWLDWNPINEFWYYTEIKDKIDHDFLRLTYLDCIEVLDPRIVASIESRKNNKNWWRVYGLGLLGEIETRIYTGWKIIDEIPFEARLERRWLDFGYTNDPTAIGDVYYHNGGYILDEQVYLKGLSNKNIADRIKAMPKTQTLIIADSAEPKSIDELRMYGLNIMPCEKGKDSVRNGIQLVQEQPISVTKRSVNIIKEYRNYLWMSDKNGKILNEPEKINDHHMDGIRYALSTLGKTEHAKNYWDRVWADELEPQYLKEKPNMAR